MKYLNTTTDPELIDERHGHAVDAVVHGGFGELYASTIIDCSSGIPDVIREGRVILTLFSKLTPRSIF